METNNGNIHNPGNIKDYIEHWHPCAAIKKNLDVHYACAGNIFQKDLDIYKYKNSTGVTLIGGGGASAKINRAN